MIAAFIHAGLGSEERRVARRTISLPDSVEELVRRNAAAGESFSAAVARLIQDGVAARHGKPRPRYVASGEGPHDLGRRAEQYLKDIVSAR
jgi:hypothetical protein